MQKVIFVQPQMMAHVDWFLQIQETGEGRTPQVVTYSGLQKTVKFLPREPHTTGSPGLLKAQVEGGEGWPGAGQRGWEGGSRPLRQKGRGLSR